MLLLRIILEDQKLSRSIGGGSQRSCRDGSCSEKAYLLRPRSRQNTVDYPVSPGSRAGSIASGRSSRTALNRQHTEDPRSGRSSRAALSRQHTTDFPEDPRSGRSSRAALSRQHTTDYAEDTRSGRSSRLALSRQATLDVPESAYTSIHSKLSDHSAYAHHSIHSKLSDRSNVKRQRTIDSAPSRYGSSRHLPRQFSTTSGGSAYLYRPQEQAKVTLVRGQSCSLVDIPTYLGSTVELGGIAGELCKTVPLATIPVFPTSGRKPPRQRLQIDLTKRKTSRKSQWTILCVALGFLCTCMALVGTMLSYTSEYQDRIIRNRLNITNIQHKYNSNDTTYNMEADHHRDVVQVIQNKFQVPVAETSLDPFRGKKDSSQNFDPTETVGGKFAVTEKGEKRRKRHSRCSRCT